MPQNTNYLDIQIGAQRIEVTDPEDLPFTIDYKLEDEDDFQVKKGSEAIKIVIPATKTNSMVANNFDQVGIEDLTTGQVFKGFQPVVVKHNGYELLVGRAVLTNAGHDDKPIDFTFDFYGDSNEWIILLKDAPLWDFLKDVAVPFNTADIVASWQFDGRNEKLPFVFAPVRYGEPMGESKDITDKVTVIEDYNMLPEYMKPSLSKYWIIYWAFKSIGYRIESQFLNTDFFRRQVMPWTWGTFLYSDGTRLDNLKFLAKSVTQVFIEKVDYHDAWDLAVVNDEKDGGFDNNDSYQYNATTKEMVWTYLPQFNYGTLDATFTLMLDLNAYANSKSRVQVRSVWFKNNVLIPGNEYLMLDLNSPALGRSRTDVDIKTITVSVAGVNPGDRISVKVKLDLFDTTFGDCGIRGSVFQFSLDYLRVPLGGTLYLKNFDSLKQYKFLDLLRGVFDEFNLVTKTDTVSKVVIIEPQHGYTLPGSSTPYTGFFNGDFIDWDRKQDLSKRSDRQLYSDIEKEVNFKYMDDSADGIQKVITDRNGFTPATARYVLPDRFQAGKKDFENRFFSATVHYSVDQWKNITGTAPQMVTIIPENISNTSASESQNTFQPKSCYYKGIVNNIGWIFNGEVQRSFPYMFAVNYLPGGENDPVLSYCDERIGDPVIGRVAQGLFKRFFLQRMAIINNGEWYQTWFNLKDYDVAGENHREFKICRSQRWELISITGYNPMKPDSTSVLMRRWVPVGYEDIDRSFPSQNSVLKGITTKRSDLKYQQLKCVLSDIP